ncbi:MAG: coenzyme F430 synthase [Methanomicrobiaceae archaeon]|nr:coenzyme F430 synthase [Methanomicrobiaceae archaeon]
MHILVLDTIHGGTTLAHHLALLGHEVDCVDVYRKETGIAPEEAAGRTYDLVVAPVHLDPDYPLLRERKAPLISHHEAVRRILEGREPRPFVEVTGARGKTTTACAIAHLLPGPGVVSTSIGTWEYPERELLWRRSITPASAIDAALHAHEAGGWCVAEESLGVSGAGEIGVLTSGDDYPVAAAKRRAVAVKQALLAGCRTVVAAPGVECAGRNVVHAEKIARVTGTTCEYAYQGIEGAFSSPLLVVPTYKSALATAAAVACLLEIDPSPLAGFAPLPGRMRVAVDGDVLVIDDANSGTGAATAIEAAKLARALAPALPLTLVIGEEARAICEGFPPEEIRRAIHAIRPERVVLVGTEAGDAATEPGTDTHYADTLEEGHMLAREGMREGVILLAVKSWR